MHVSFHHSLGTIASRD